MDEYDYGLIRMSHFVSRHSLSWNLLSIAKRGNSIQAMAIYLNKGC